MRYLMTELLENEFEKSGYVIREDPNPSSSHYEDGFWINTKENPQWSIGYVFIKGVRCSP